MPVESNVKDLMAPLDEDAEATAGRTLKKAVPDLK
jgi:hypothetical protein